MISTEQMAEILTQQLNKITDEFKFVIYPNVGEFKARTEGTQKSLPTPLVNGILLSLPSAVVPLQSVKSYTASQLLTILAPCEPPTSKGNIDKVMSVIHQFIESQAGFTGYLTDAEGKTYSYIFAPQLPQVGQASNQSVGFWHVPVSISLTWQFIAGGVISNGIKVTIDGTDAILLDGSLVRTRIAQTNNKQNSSEMQSIIGQQGLTIKIIVPYITDNVGAKMMSDLVLGSLKKTYRVEYNDGLVKLPNGDNPQWTMVATEITTNIQAGTVVSLTTTLVIADEQIYSEA